ncbi:Rhodanese-like domain-containing protein [Radiomyces spectabilis]|uniref:Rhodanese-like domain-containing protein n=1 Tax=Radiomyces spectabilis TaxID=64574 RepID=UPI00221F2E29|nr:Rhodanese-like domain-containing protein [Radiomyces spectabilis]KAI8381594.1 Rhodanese-like domain-containing protein [Radiomyces spectabilis]
MLFSTIKTHISYSALIRSNIVLRPLSSACALPSRWGDVVKRTQEQLKVAEISASELKNYLSSEFPSKSTDAPVIIDVREASEWQNGKIPHAVCLSRGVLELGIEKVISPDCERPIILYCAGGLRSIMAAEALVRMGYNKDKLTSLRGGFSAWHKEGYPIECK